MVWFRKKAAGLKSAHPQLRTELLAESPLATAAERTNDDPDTPLARFTAAQASLQVGDRAQARRHLHELLSLPEIDTPTRLQAWSCLRELDELPSPGAGAVVRGVVVEFGDEQGLETIAAFEDHTATWLPATGEVVHVDAGAADCSPAITALLHAGRAVVDHTHPHRGHSENPPEAGHACIRVQTYAGTHIGLGATRFLDSDPVGGPALQAAAALRAAMAAHLPQRT